MGDNQWPRRRSDMRATLGLLTAAAVVAVTSAAHADDSDKFLIRGNAAKVMMEQNQIIGAVGVGGSAPNLPAWSDEICAHSALTKVIGPQPDLLPDVRPNTTAAPPTR